MSVVWGPGWGLPGSVPQVRWKEEESPPQEPSVVANAAKTSASSSDVVVSTGKEPEKSSGEVDVPAAVSSEANTIADRSATIRSKETLVNVGHIEETDQSVTDGNIESLKAALDEDERRGHEYPRQLAGSDDARVKVESLLERAHNLLSQGKLREAKQAAQAAHELGEIAHVDFAPSEDRPVDLVHQIEDRMQEESNEKATANEASAQPTMSLTPTKDSTAAEDQRSKARKDWTYGLSVFRRDRKSVTASPATTVQQPAPSTAIADISSVPVQMTLEVEPDSIPESHDAVVRANRSVSLAAKRAADPETSFTPGRDATQEAFDTSSTEHTHDRLLDADLTERPVAEVDLPAEPHWVEASDESRLLPPDNDAPPEIDDLRPIARFHDVARRSLSMSSEPAVEPPEEVAGWTWVIGLVVFGICGIFAVFWYRRGAT